MSTEKHPGAPSELLAINGGSSSVKFALFRAGVPPQEVIRGKIERAGTADARLVAPGTDRRVAASNPREVAAALAEWLATHHASAGLAGIGHRLVHGGPNHAEPGLVTPELLRDLEGVKALDPTHLPAELDFIAAFAEQFPQVPQVACFDTAFHRDLPTVARTLPLPRHYQASGLRRYGFHGLSYEYLTGELARVAPAEARGRVVLAHLGSGASLAAVRGGKCVDTTMGFTPTGGLVMGTRTGDLDPGTIVHLVRSEKLSADRLDKLVNRESGLLGISETSADVRDLLAREATDPRAAEAVAVFCYQARKFVGAMAAALGGLDTLVFAGGVGENSPEIRARVCDGLGFLGVQIAPNRNPAGADVVSEPGAPVAVRVIRTNEEAVIARAVMRFLNH